MYMIDIKPVNGIFANGKHRVTYGYMCKEYGSAHYGADLVAGAVWVENDVLAIEDGVVENVKTTVTGTLNLNVKANWSHPDVLGNIIKIKHNERFSSRMCHLKHGSIKLKAGDKVKKGQIIATIGNTGLSSAPHVHFEIFDNGNRIDPVPFMLGTRKITDKTAEALEVLKHVAGLPSSAPKGSTTADALELLKKAADLT